jgi:ADP-ribose pyrophosphatase YjhB (NUDIX family)
MYCNNCGFIGHAYAQCKNPIMSYGVILVSQEEDKNKILMIQRKDSLCYIDFLRGKYNINNISYILNLCNHFNSNEKENIIKYSFDELWSELWKYNKNLKSHVKNEYKIGKDKFLTLQKGFTKNNQWITLDYFYKNITTTYKTSEWEFPKGRRNENEKNKECAIREFEEETNLDKSDYQLFSNVYPISEEYYGENNIKYKHVYYLGVINDVSKEVGIDQLNKHQMSEISDIQWVTKEEGYSKIRDYNTTKYKIIDTVFTFIDNYKDDLFIHK